MKHSVRVAIVFRTSRFARFPSLDGFPVFCPGGSADPRAQLRELFRQLEAETQTLSNAVDSVSVRSPELTSVYKTLLLSKATSQATLSCLRRCLSVIKRRDMGCAEQSSHFVWVNSDGAGSGEHHGQTPSENSNPSGLSRSRCSSTGGGDESSVSSRGSDQLMGVGAFPSPILNMDSQAINLPELPADAQPDAPFDETELGSVEEQKHVVLHLLSQLKLGMDLTKIVLPTFILEKRSLLEMFADYMAHPDLYLQITRAPDPESRMIAFVQWYLTTFHAGRKDKICKKPYNPIIGESFHCCWPLDPQIATDGFMSSTDKSPTTAQSNPTSSVSGPEATPDEKTWLTYCAEQVSHHPPVTAFYFDCPAYKMELNASLYAKSKFQGMSVSVTMLGKTVLRLGEHNEEYHFSFPTAYARSILTVPWVELADKVAITCPQTGYSASVTFHTKPMRSNKLHRISAEVFGPTPPMTNGASAERPGSSSAPLIARVTGEWNGIMEFEHLTRCGRNWLINVSELPIAPKHVRPIESQRPEESRRLWQHVTTALQAGNIREATERKRELEERQRASEKYRVRHRIPFPVKFFEWNGSAWSFRNPLPPLSATAVQSVEPGS
ncbi:Oxysterol-binding protein 11 [Fasciola gigantica]|uniref:Oxysterol-binding protein n=1 Tax=Fasciola gigantica TaxID=46835 RepID=A0A504Z5V7_FASGI|nr:Oxysterol-binding protein 11 [Fasciola gigantica]